MQALVRKLLLFGNTVRYLKPRQFFYFFLRRIIPSGETNTGPPEGLCRNPCFSLSPAIVPTNLARDDHIFCFLNIEKDFSSGIDWSDTSLPKLWRYNLHYFDYLLEPSRSNESKCALIESWIIHNSIGAGDGWEPYTASLRIVNWIKFFSTLGSTDIKQSWVDSLALQANWLEKNIEYHILANHYLKNGKALAFAGVFFQSNAARRWLEIGLDIVKTEADEQLLPDGGHYERSPMYHSIVTEDYLDLYNLLISNETGADQVLLDLVKAKNISALEYLADMTMPDGDIALFNDSAFFIAPKPEQLYLYAGRLFGYERPEKKNDLSVSSYPHTGYYIIRNDDDMMVIDCGAGGPDYQPGHTHCDTLSYELAVNGQRVIVDSGVHDYEDSELRRYVRSTRAHNTVMIDEEEQSEIWGVFRVARRAKPISASVEKLDNHSAVFEGEHDGYQRLKGKPIHKRRIEYLVGTGWAIVDTVTGSGRHKIESFIHIHPAFKACMDGNAIKILDDSGSVLASIICSDMDRVNIVKGWYCPEFGKKYLNDVVVLMKIGDLPVKMSYSIKNHNDAYSLSDRQLPA